MVSRRYRLRRNYRGEIVDIRLNMSCRFSLNRIFDEFQTDPFWAVTHLSWLFSHWTWSNLVFGTIFSATTIGLHMFVWLLIYTSYFNEYINRSQTALSRAVYCTTLFTHTLIVPVLITTWMIRGWKRVRHFASVIRTVDKRLTRVGITTRNGFVQMEWLVMVFAPLIGVVYFMQRAEFPPNEEGFQFSKSFSALMKFYVYNHFLIGTYVPCFFAFFTLVVHDRYRSINSLLENISGAEYGDKDIAGNEGRVTLAEWIAAVRELRALHRKLFFAAEKISRAFGLQILQLTVLTLASVVSGFYNYHVANVLQCGMTKFDRRRIFLQAVLELGPICVAAYHGGRTIGQARRTVNVLQDIGVSNDILRLEISAFSLQLIDYDLRFSACGFFDIDLSLIRKITGTVMTYLIILIQIGNLQEHCRSISGWTDYSRNNVTDSSNTL